MVNGRIKGTAHDQYQWNMPSQITSCMPIDSCRIDPIMGNRSNDEGNDHSLGWSRVWQILLKIRAPQVNDT